MQGHSYGMLSIIDVCCRDKIILLNQATEIINFWQDNEPKKTVEEARAAFPDCTFQGAT